MRLRKLHTKSGRGYPATWPTHVDKIAISLYSKPSEICPPARGTREGHKEVHRRKHCKEPQSNQTRKNRARRQMSTARMRGSEGNGNGNGMGVGVGETTDRRSDKRNTSYSYKTETEDESLFPSNNIVPCYYASGSETRRARGIVGPSDSPRSIGFEVANGSCSKPLRIDPSVERRFKPGVERSMAAMLWSSPCASSASRRV